MDEERPKRVPWRSWGDFTEWAQDFSLRKKVLGGFLAVVVLVGLLTSLMGTRLVRTTILDSAKSRLAGDLATAGFVMDNIRERLELKVRLTAGSDTLAELIQKGETDAVRNRLAMIGVENDLDYLSLTDPEGNVIGRAFQRSATEQPVPDLSKEPLIMGATDGNASSGVLLIDRERLISENPALVQRLHSPDMQKAMVIEAACPIILGTELIAVLYGGTVVNDNSLIVDRISRLVFKGATHEEEAIGLVNIYQGNSVISTTVRGEEGLPLHGAKAGPSVGRAVLERGSETIEAETINDMAYLSAARPIRDANGTIIGALQVATLKGPIISVANRLVEAFFVIALLGVLLMAGITYFLVQWINRPLELMLNAARRAAEGDLSHEVPVVARDEVGELAATFNVMIKNLAESRKKLEEWGKELASKVAEQTGELRQAQEQVARVQKLASLEKMADGMAHIMAHISDPLVSMPYEEADSSATSKVLVVDTEERVLDVCTTVLEDEGLETRTARTTGEALSHLEHEFFDVVVADVDMPGMGVKDFLKQIKYRQPDVVVILTATFKSTEDAVEAVKLGAFDYIPKPFGPHQILLMVYTALQTRQAVDRTRRQHASTRAETIFQRLPVAIALADKQHRVVYNNQALVDLAAKGDPDAVIRGKTFEELFGVDPLDMQKGPNAGQGSRWLELSKVGRTAKLYNFKLEEEDLRVLMLLDITETVEKDKQADVLRTETMARAQQVIHQQMRVAQEIAGLLGETTAETKAALFELIKLAGEAGESR